MEAQHLALAALGSLAFELVRDVRDDDHRVAQRSVRADRTICQLQRQVALSHDLRQLLERQFQRQVLVDDGATRPPRSTGRPRGRSARATPRAWTAVEGPEPFVDDARALVGYGAGEIERDESLPDVVQHQPHLIVARVDPILAHTDRVRHRTKRARQLSHLVARLHVDLDFAPLLSRLAAPTSAPSGPTTSRRASTMSRMLRPAATATEIKSALRSSREMAAFSGASENAAATTATSSPLTSSTGATGTTRSRSRLIWMLVGTLRTVSGRPRSSAARRSRTRPSRSTFQTAAYSTSSLRASVVRFC